jgi:hypothetical protein
MDLCSIGVPLINEQRQTAAAINVSLGAMERSNQDMVEAALRQLIAKGKLISRLLGYDGPYPKIFSNWQSDEPQDFSGGIHGQGSVSQK